MEQDTGIPQKINFFRENIDIIPVNLDKNEKKVYNEGNYQRR